MSAKRADNTMKAYRSAWAAFQQWCAEAGRSALPAHPETVEQYLIWCIAEAKYRLDTVQGRISAIKYFHKQGAMASPINDAIRELMSNARRYQKEEPRGKAALTYEQLRRIAGLFGNKTPLDQRNRAMILLGFAAGWRRSEIATLHISNVRFVSRGIKLWLPKSKTDQIGKGRWVGIQPGKHALTCPVRAVKAWMKTRGDWDGPLFLRFTRNREMTREGLGERGEALHVVIKHAIEDIGEDPDRFGAHSLRAGMITVAAEHGASETSIMERTGHRSITTLRRYIRHANVFAMNPLAAVL